MAKGLDNGPPGPLPQSVIIIGVKREESLGANIVMVVIHENMASCPLGAVVLTEQVVNLTIP